MTDTPDPSEVETLESDESTFQRDEQGNLLPYWKVIEVDDEYKKIKLEPTPVGEFERLENRWEGLDDVPTEELTDLLNRKILEPDVDWSEAKPVYYAAALQALISEIFGEEATGIAAEVEAELEDRRAEAGN